MNVRIQTSFLFGKRRTRNYIKRMGNEKEEERKNIQQSRIIKGRAECVCVWLGGRGGGCSFLFDDGAV